MTEKYGTPVNMCAAVCVDAVIKNAGDTKHLWDKWDRD